MIVLDTHAWIWFVNAPSQLSPRAIKAIETAMDQGKILISAISTWEIGLLAKKGRLVLKTHVADWISQSEKLPFFNFVPVDNTIALKSIHLPAPFHEDPADRIIVATALAMGAELVTKDQKIRDVRIVKTIW